MRLGTGFEPASIVVAGDQPVRLTFRRDIELPHEEVVVFPTLGRMATLPPGCDVSVTLPALAPGTYPFTASGTTARGTLVVRGQ